MFLVMASESVKAVYERARRKKHSGERRIYQVLYPWLRIMHPEVFMEFNNFFTQLAERNPRTKNLTTSDDFKHFYRRGKGGYYVFVFFDSVEYTASYFLLYGNFVDFTFESIESGDPITEAMASAEDSIASTSRDTIAEDSIASTSRDTIAEDSIESTSRDTIAEDSIESTSRDTIAEVQAFIKDFDYEVEVFDWENFEDDINFIEGMDLSGYLDDNRFFS